mmetsp:Transcript_95210/g.159908  ORF Transcript_95210/g.159908 Transcript_95210/m.159908 type:complete len:99 (+) Transcript_95210:1607-1903(+)|eukprot:CAMPEP_0174310390 /NCGR_PEP_ID=MMETSP0810-20121108/3017_1 /TAXON_ID=73025 ORGANISM="Eutreptiella gymnastica-like, Strain CCMP1594" /NCGR_SAMPLE_ID=MMETSP0810 /ASSEMBLY_ACC=CAM_ASM_000659 /LENGTH=98 /DNA_ID=CAMNT_0015418285 /DNA_START=1595 /DNA_END=1891 /DNA_ORIENTATION=-
MNNARMPLTVLRAPSSFGTCREDSSTQVETLSPKMPNFGQHHHRHGIPKGHCSSTEGLGGSLGAMADPNLTDSSLTTHAPNPPTGPKPPHPSPVGCMW